MTEKIPQRKMAPKSLKKGRSDFREKVTSYGIEGGSIVRCEKHPDQLVKSRSGPEGGIERVEHAWQVGWISSDVEPAKDLFIQVYEGLPDECSKCECSGFSEEE